jgi:hypothetical protein
LNISLTQLHLRDWIFQGALVQPQCGAMQLGFSSMQVAIFVESPAGSG